jgi:hypothetical protein
MFEKSLQDLIKGIRNQKSDTTAYIAKCIQEIKDELKSRDVTIKTQALAKMVYVRTMLMAVCGNAATVDGTPLRFTNAALLVYSVPMRTLCMVCLPLHKFIVMGFVLQLNMCGNEMSWAAFHVIEVMTQERFGLKRVGFTAAALTFTPQTDVLVLCTQLLKKVGVGAQDIRMRPPLVPSMRFSEY